MVKKQVKKLDVLEGTRYTTKRKKKKVFSLIKA
jgi:hypothetical protein